MFKDINPGMTTEIYWKMFCKQSLVFDVIYSYLKLSKESCHDFPGYSGMKNVSYAVREIWCSLCSKSFHVVFSH